MATVYPEHPQQSLLVQLPLFDLEKRCARCGALKPTTRFSSNKGAPDGLFSWCKDCQRAYRRAYATNPRRGIRSRNRQLVTEGLKLCSRCLRVKPLTAYRAHAGSPHGRNSQCRSCASQAKRQRYLEERAQPAFQERNRHRVRTWYHANLMRARRRGRNYAATHRAEALERVRAWKAGNPERDAFNNHNKDVRRRLRRMQAEGVHDRADLRLIHEAQRGLCAYCMCSLPVPWTVDHMTALIDGGSNWPWNLCLACPSCNSRKNRRSAGEFFARLLKEKRKQGSIA